MIKTTSSLRLPVVLLLTALLLAGGGCWRRGDGPTQLAVQPSAGEVAANVQPAAQTPKLAPVAYVPGAEQRNPGGPLRHELKHIDPSIERWLSEDYAEAAARQLNEIFVLARKQKPNFSAVASDSFWCGPLRPQRNEIFRDAAFTVWKGDPPRPWETSREFKGPAGLGEAMTELLAPLAKADDVHHEFSVNSVEQRESRTITDVSFQAAGRTADGQLQLSARWKCTWQSDDKAPRLLSIDVNDYFEALAHLRDGTLFADVTESVLSNNKAWRGQLVWGLDHWAQRLDATVAPAVGGLTGLAVGDVNGDGMDDLYLCASRGLPNRLLVQQPDGTANDVSQAAGVDWMDASSSALLVDLDNDGDQDLIVAVGNSVLFHENDGQAKFTLKLSVELDSEPMSMAAADYDDDGRLDVYICCHTPSTGEQVEVVLGVPVPLYDANNGAANALLRSAGDWKFENVTAASGLDQNNRRYSFACAWEDYDNDGDQDLYVANEFGRNNLYRNDGGAFRDVADADAQDVGMGQSVSWADFNRDGRMDLYVGNWFSAAGGRVAQQARFRAGQNDAVTQIRRLARGNSLLVGSGSLAFQDVSDAARVGHAGWAWSSRFCDINNDGRDDLVVANGFVTGERPEISSFFWRRVASQSPTAQGDAMRAAGYRNAWLAASRMLRGGHDWSGHERNCCFLNLDGEKFVDVSSPAGVDFLDDARGIAVTDWDQDGDLDLWLSNRNAPRVRLLTNNASGKSIAFRLQGTMSNRDAIGARLELEFASSGKPLIRTLRAGEGFLSQSTKWVHFGLGDAEQVARLRVRWPGGAVDEYKDLQPGKRYKIVQGESSAREIAPRARVNLKASSPQFPDDGPFGRVALVGRPPLPELQCKGRDGDWISLGGESETLTLITLWASWHPASVAELKELANREFDLRLAELKVVALAVDEAAAGEDIPAAAAEVLQQIKAPYTFGVANPNVIHRIDILRRAVMSVDRGLPLPSSLLVDKQGRVCAIYNGRMNFKQVFYDAKHVDADPKELRDRAVPLAGRWRSEPSPISPIAVAREFRNDGSNDAAIAYLRQLVDIGRNRKPGYEQLLPDEIFYLLGNLLEDKGQTADAQRAYETVLQYDPQHADAQTRLAKLKASGKP